MESVLSAAELQIISPTCCTWFSYRDHMLRGMGTLLLAILRVPCTEGLMNLLILTEYTQKYLTTSTQISEGARQCVLNDTSQYKGLIALFM